MTRAGIKEYLDTIRPRYIRARRKEKSRILDEAQKVTGLHRKALSLCLRAQAAPVGKKPGGQAQPLRLGSRHGSERPVEGQRPGLHALTGGNS